MINKDNTESDIKTLIFLSSLVFICTLFLFIYLWRNIQMANLDYEIEKLKREKKKLHLEVESLNLSIARYTTPDKIEKILQEHEVYLPVRTGKRIISVKLPQLDLKQETQKPSRQNPDSKEDLQNIPGEDTDNK